MIVCPALAITFSCLQINYHLKCEVSNTTYHGNCLQIVQKSRTVEACTIYSSNMSALLKSDHVRNKGTSIA